MPVPAQPKIYHIVHIDRLASILRDGFLWCDAEVHWRNCAGTTIGMSTIKQRRLSNFLSSHSQLRVGDCVPFYFCPRSIMLYLLYQANHPELVYKGGQEPLIHLEADLFGTVEWANQHRKRYAFTLSNAGSSYFEDRADLAQLSEIDWDAVQSTSWRENKEKKQAEFLIEYQFPWQLIERIGVYSTAYFHRVNDILRGENCKPLVQIMKQWYY